MELVFHNQFNILFLKTNCKSILWDLCIVSLCLRCLFLYRKGAEERKERIELTAKHSKIENPQSSQSFKYPSG